MAHMRANLKYDQVFAIVRVDKFQGLLESPEVAITVKKVVWTQELAETEVARLNYLNKDKDCVYFWKVTRLERKNLI